VNITVNTGTSDGEDGVEQRGTDVRIDLGDMLLLTGDDPNKALHHSLGAVRHRCIHSKRKRIERDLVAGRGVLFRNMPVLGVLLLLRQEECLTRR
jgi:hypothetical protein